MKNYKNLCVSVIITEFIVVLLTISAELSEEFKNILKAMTDEIGKENLVCFAKKDSYASSVKLPLGTFWCADSTGYMNTISSMINGYSCK